MTLAVCWIAFPLVLAAISLGCGLLVEQIAGRRLPGVLLVPAGLATVIVVAQVAAATDATAEFAVPAVLALAAGGFALTFPWEGSRPSGWAIAAAVGAYAAYAAPIVLSGEATFAGYIKLDDTATWFALTDRIMEHGRSLDALAPSSYEATLDFNLADGYPIGIFLPLGIGRELVGQDVAWVFQPYVAFLGANLALVLYSLTRPLVRSGALRALVAALAAQSALLFGYSLWGGVKEVAAAGLVALVAALAPRAASGPGGLRGVVPVAIATAAVVAVLSAGGAIWVLPVLAGALVLAARELGVKGAAVRAAAFAAVTALLCVPVFVSGLLPPTSSPLTSDTAKGNLIKPLNPLQFFGVWPVGDFRLEPKDLEVTYVLIAVVALAGLAGLVWAWKRRAWEMVGYVLTASLGCLVVVGVGSPWVDGKALATASPAFLAAALAAAAMTFERGRRVEALLAAAAIAAGIVWSNALAYHDVSLAPRDRLAELEQIGHRVKGQGPALMTDYEPYGVRHFLRGSDAEGASELRRRLIPLRSGGSLDKLGYADIDELQLDGILDFRTLVLRRSPVGSRPPSPYRRVYSGRWYDVWQRPAARAPEIAEHLPLGTRLDPTARPRCDAIQRLARLAGPDGRLLAARRPEPIVVDVGAVARPPRWQRSSEDTAAVVPVTPGTLWAAARLARTGAYELWLGGSFRRLVDLTVDDIVSVDERDQLNHAGQWVPLGTAELAAGRRALTLTYPEPDWRPGSGEPPFAFGPIALTPRGSESRIESVDPARAGELCGRQLDWVEAVRL